MRRTIRGGDSRRDVADTDDERWTHDREQIEEALRAAAAAELGDLAALIAEGRRSELGNDR